MNANDTSLKYAVDIALCIDVTGSMAPVLERVKQSALSFHKRLEEAMSAKQKAISQMRLRVVAYRDFADNPGDALAASEFWNIPEQTSDFERLTSSSSSPNCRTRTVTPGTRGVTATWSRQGL